MVQGYSKARRGRQMGILEEVVFSPFTVISEGETWHPRLLPTLPSSGLVQKWSPNLGKSRNHEASQLWKSHLMLL